jgi:16S rRNA (cytosine967-C5)-methyltransferase
LNTAKTYFKLAINGLEEWENNYCSVDDYLDRKTTVANGQRRIVASLLFTYFRNKKQIDRVIAGEGKKIKPRIHRLLSIALTAAWFQNSIPKEAAVDTAVHYAKRRYGHKQAGFVNAILRNIVDRSDIGKKILEDRDPFSSLPKILKKRWMKQFDEEVVLEIAELLRTQAKLTWRSTGEIDDSIVERSKSVALPPFEWGSGCKFYECSNPSFLFVESHLEPNIYIQDPSTTMAPSFVEIKPDMLILDLCAAPGGKSKRLCERIETGKVIAADSSFTRQQRTLENLNKHPEKCWDVVVSDLFNPCFKEEIADAVLLDVPCSNTGVFRRRPDAVWRFSEKHIGELLEKQKHFLAAATPFVKVGGQLLYSTCSIETEENEDQILRFLEENTNFVLVKDKLLLPTRYNDGGYCALLKRQS